jgi:hypothetical protein
MCKAVQNFTFQFLSFVMLFNLSWGLYEIEVHRMFGYEYGEQWVGSKVQSFTMVAAHFAGESLRKLAMIRFEEINEHALEDLYARKPGGILIILPSQFNDAKRESHIWGLITLYIGICITSINW